MAEATALAVEVRAAEHMELVAEIPARVEAMAVGT